MDMSGNGPKRPAFQSFGGKWRLAPWIIGRLPNRRIYVEPFGGAASVLLRKRPSKVEIYNDLNHDVANLFAVLKDESLRGRLLERLRLTTFGRHEYDAAWSERDPDPVAAAGRFVVKSQMSVCPSTAEVRRSGFDTTKLPKDAYDYAGDWVDYGANLPLVAERLRGVIIESRDAFEIIRRYDHGDALFYCDPPYVHSARRTDKTYGRFEMSDEDHASLAGILRSLAGTAAVSGYRPGELYDRLYSGWTRFDKTVHCLFGDTRVESLWLSPGSERPRLF
jgi:DNA adenine methylase